MRPVGLSSDISSFLLVVVLEKLLVMAGLLVEVVFKKKLAVCCTRWRGDRNMGKKKRGC
jgi:hypothetical protein